MPIEKTNWDVGGKKEATYCVLAFKKVCRSDFSAKTHEYDELSKSGRDRDPYIKAVPGARCVANVQYNR